MGEGMKEKGKKGTFRGHWLTLRRVGPYVKPHWALGLSTAGLIALGVVFSLAHPWPLALLIDNVLGGRPAPEFLTRAFGTEREMLLIVAVTGGLVIALGMSGLAVLTNYITTKLDQRMILDFRGDLFWHAQHLSLSLHDKMQAGALMNRINLQASNIGSVTLALPPLVQSAITLVGMFWISYKLQPQLALISLTVVPFIYYSVGYYANRIEPYLQKVKGMEGQSLSIVHEAMTMVKIVVAFGREPYEYKKFRDHGESTVTQRVKLTVRQTLFSMVVSVITAVGTALVLGYGALLVLQGRLDLGKLLVIIAYLAAVYKPLEAISNALVSLQEQLVALRMSFDLLDIDPEISDSPEAVPIERSVGHIKFEGVHFAYKGRQASLEDISFEAYPGQVVAVVGATGAGKSTLVSLIPRFQDPARGRVLLDGKDLRDITVESLRRNVSMVLQDPLLFSGSIIDNIRYGRLEATDEEVYEAASAAGAHEFIERLPKKYETEIGERGSQLSGGERQRISIARAFLKDSPILILDEPTSSVDSKTEGKILEALDRLMANRTTFIIAHRLSTVRSADLYLVLDRGKILEQGAREDLIEHGQYLRQMIAVQQGRHLPTERAKRSSASLINELAMKVSEAADARGKAQAALKDAERSEVVAWARDALNSGNNRKAVAAARIARTLALAELALDLLSRAAIFPPQGRVDFIGALQSFDLAPATLIDLLNQLHPERRAAGARLIWRVSRKKVLPLLKEQFASQSQEFRLAVIEISSELGTGLSTRIRTDALAHDPSPVVRAASVRSLRRTLRDKVVPFVSVALSDPDRQVRAAAITPLPRTSDNCTPGDLLKALLDPEELVWRAAVRRLERMADPDLILNWVELLRHPRLRRSAQGSEPTMSSKEISSIAEAIASLEDPGLHRHLLTIREAAKAVGTTENVVRRWEKRGLVRSKKVARGGRKLTLVWAPDVDLARAVNGQDHSQDGQTEFLTLTAAAERVGVRESTIRRWERKGFLRPEHRFDGNGRSVSHFNSNEIEMLRIRMQPLNATPTAGDEKNGLVARLGTVAVEPLVGLLGESGNGVTASEAARLLCRILGPEPFVELLGSDEPTRRIGAINSLRLIGGHDAMLALKRASNDPDPLVRQAAGSLMGGRVTRKLGSEENGAKEGWIGWRRLIGRDVGQHGETRNEPSRTPSPRGREETLKTYVERPREDD